MRSLMLVALMTLAACGGGEAPAEAPAEEAKTEEAAKTDEAPAEEAKAEETAANTEAGEQVEYVCPMHLTQKSDKPGECGECGMALEKKVVKAEAAPAEGEGAEKKEEGAAH